MISCHSNAMPGVVLCVTGISELGVFYPPRMARFRRHISHKRHALQRRIHLQKSDRRPLDEIHANFATDAQLGSR